MRHISTQNSATLRFKCCGKKIRQFDTFFLAGAASRIPTLFRGQGGQILIDQTKKKRCYSHICQGLCNYITMWPPCELISMITRTAMANKLQEGISFGNTMKGLSIHCHAQTGEKNTCIRRYTWCRNVQKKYIPWAFKTYNVQRLLWF